MSEHCEHAQLLFEVEIAHLLAERDEALAQVGVLIQHLREDDHGYGCRLCGCNLSDPSMSSAAARALLDRLKELATRNVSLGQDILVYETESAQLKRRLQRALDKAVAVVRAAESMLEEIHANFGCDPECEATRHAALAAYREQAHQDTIT